MNKQKVYKPLKPIYNMTKKDKELILKVTEVKTSKQRRINIPKEDETMKKGDLVKVKKVEIK